MLEGMNDADRRAVVALFGHWNWDRGVRVRDETNVVFLGVESLRPLRRRFLATPSLAGQIVLQTAKYSSTVSLHRYPSSHQDHIYSTDPSSAAVVVVTVDRRQRYVAQAAPCAQRSKQRAMNSASD